VGHREHHGVVDGRHGRLGALGGADLEPHPRAIGVAGHTPPSRRCRSVVCGWCSIFSQSTSHRGARRPRARPSGSPRSAVRSGSSVACANDRALVMLLPHLLRLHWAIRRKRWSHCRQRNGKMPTKARQAAGGNVQLPGCRSAGRHPGAMRVCALPSPQVAASRGQSSSLAHRRVSCPGVRSILSAACAARMNHR
jgi:hypothetical protein